MLVTEVKISDLKPADYNPRKISEAQEKSLQQSLERFGFVDPVVVNQHKTRKNILVGGHQRVKVWGNMGNKTVPVVFVELTKEKERELNVRLNRASGEWDWSLLQEFFKKDELLQWGFTEDDLFGRYKTKTIGDDDAPGLPSKAKSKTGDFYVLGPHSLLCGDSTSQADIDKLTGKEPVDLIFTDPPYNVNYSGQGKKTSRKIENDNMAEKDFRVFLQYAFAAMAHASKDTAALYCCYASSTHREFEDSLNAAMWEVKNQIIWVKTVASMGWGDYRWKHEPMFYCRKPGSKVEFYADRTQTTAWDEMPKDEELLDLIKKMIKKEEDGNSTVWRFSRESQYVHPTQKPVALVTKAILNSSKTHGTVLDPFGGSGSTLIACEKNDRCARIMEMDCGFSDVIVKRYVEFCQKNGRPWNVAKNGTDISDSFNPVKQ